MARRARFKFLFFIAVNLSMSNASKVEYFTKIL